MSSPTEQLLKIQHNYLIVIVSLQHPGDCKFVRLFTKA